MQHELSSVTLWTVGWCALTLLTCLRGCEATALPRLNNTVHNLYISALMRDAATPVGNDVNKQSILYDPRSGKCYYVATNARVVQWFWADGHRDEPEGATSNSSGLDVLRYAPELHHVYGLTVDPTGLPWRDYNAKKLHPESQFVGRQVLDARLYDVTGSFIGESWVFVLAGAGDAASDSTAEMFMLTRFRTFLLRTLTPSVSSVPTLPGRRIDPIMQVAYHASELQLQSSWSTHSVTSFGGVEAYPVEGEKYWDRSAVLGGAAPEPWYNNGSLLVGALASESQDGSRILAAHYDTQRQAMYSSWYMYNSMIPLDGCRTVQSKQGYRTDFVGKTGVGYGSGMVDDPGYLTPQPAVSMTIGPVTAISMLHDGSQTCLLESGPRSNNVVCVDMNSMEARLVWGYGGPGLPTCTFDCTASISAIQSSQFVVARDATSGVDIMYMIMWRMIFRYDFQTGLYNGVVGTGWSAANDLPYYPTRAHPPTRMTIVDPAFDFVNTNGPCGLSSCFPKGELTLIGASKNALYITVNYGGERSAILNLSGFPDMVFAPLPSEPTLNVNCSINVHCNGRALRVMGNPALDGCHCSCVRGWEGFACDTPTVENAAYDPATAGTPAEVFTLVKGLQDPTSVAFPITSPFGTLLNPPTYASLNSTDPASLLLTVSMTRSADSATGAAGTMHWVNTTSGKAIKITMGADPCSSEECYAPDPMPPHALVTSASITSMQLLEDTTVSPSVGALSVSPVLLLAEKGILRLWKPFEKVTEIIVGRSVASSRMTPNDGYWSGLNNQSLTTVNVEDNDDQYVPRHSRAGHQFITAARYLTKTGTLVYATNQQTANTNHITESGAYLYQYSSASKRPVLLLQSVKTIAPVDPPLPAWASADSMRVPNGNHTFYKILSITSNWDDSRIFYSTMDTHQVRELDFTDGLSIRRGGDDVISDCTANYGTNNVALQTIFRCLPTGLVVHRHRDWTSLPILSAPIVETLYFIVASTRFGSGIVKMSNSLTNFSSYYIIAGFTDNTNGLFATPEVDGVMMTNNVAFSASRYPDLTVDSELLYFTSPVSGDVKAMRLVQSGTGVAQKLYPYVPCNRSDTNWASSQSPAWGVEGTPATGCRWLCKAGYTAVPSSVNNDVVCQPDSSAGAGGLRAVGETFTVAAYLPMPLVTAVTSTPSAVARVPTITSLVFISNGSLAGGQLYAAAPSLGTVLLVNLTRASMGGLTSPSSATAIVLGAPWEAERHCDAAGSLGVNMTLRHPQHLSLMSPGSATGGDSSDRPVLLITESMATRVLQFNLSNRSAVPSVFIGSRYCGGAAPFPTYDSYDVVWHPNEPRRFITATAVRWTAQEVYFAEVGSLFRVPFDGELQPMYVERFSGLSTAPPPSGGGGTLPPFVLDRNMHGQSLYTQSGIANPLYFDETLTLRHTNAYVQHPRRVAVNTVTDMKLFQDRYLYVVHNGDNLISALDFHTGYDSDYIGAAGPRAAVASSYRLNDCFSNCQPEFISLFRPHAMIIVQTPQGPMLYATSTLTHSIWAINLRTWVANRLLGGPLLTEPSKYYSSGVQDIVRVADGYVDSKDPAAVRLRYPTAITASSTTLYFFDSDSGVIRGHQIQAAASAQAGAPLPTFTANMSTLTAYGLNRVVPTNPDLDFCNVDCSPAVFYKHRMENRHNMEVVSNNQYAMTQGLSLDPRSNVTADGNGARGGAASEVAGILFNLDGVLYRAEDGRNLSVTYTTGASPWRDISGAQYAIQNHHFSRAASSSPFLAPLEAHEYPEGHEFSARSLHCFDDRHCLVATWKPLHIAALDPMMQHPSEGDTETWKTPFYELWLYDRQERMYLPFYGQGARFAAERSVANDLQLIPINIPRVPVTDHFNGPNSTHIVEAAAAAALTAAITEGVDIPVGVEGGGGTDTPVHRSNESYVPSYAYFQRSTGTVFMSVQKYFGFDWLGNNNQNETFWSQTILGRVNKITHNRQRTYLGTGELEYPGRQHVHHEKAQWRLHVSTQSCGQLDVFADTTMYVVDERAMRVRAVDMNSGNASVLAGRGMQLEQALERCAVDCKPWQLSFYPTGVVAHSNGDIVFISANTEIIGKNLGYIYVYRYSTGRMTRLAGKVPLPWKVFSDPNFVFFSSALNTLRDDYLYQSPGGIQQPGQGSLLNTSVNATATVTHWNGATFALTAVGHLVVTGRYLYAVEARGIVAMELPPTVPTNTFQAVTSSSRHICNNADHCFGRAWKVSGLTSTKCFCFCHLGYGGDACELTTAQLGQANEAALIATNPSITPNNAIEDHDDVQTLITMLPLDITSKSTLGFVNTLQASSLWQQNAADNLVPPGSLYPDEWSSTYLSLVTGEFDGFLGLTWSPYDGQLYATGASALWRIDPQTGAAMKVMGGMPDYTSVKSPFPWYSPSMPLDELYYFTRARSTFVEVLGNRSFITGGYGTTMKLIRLAANSSQPPNAPCGTTCSTPFDGSLGVEGNNSFIVSPVFGPNEMKKHTITDTLHIDSSFPEVDLRDTMNGQDMPNVIMGGRYVPSVDGNRDGGLLYLTILMGIYYSAVTFLDGTLNVNDGGMVTVVHQGMWLAYSGQLNNRPEPLFSFSHRMPRQIDYWNGHLFVASAMGLADIDTTTQTPRRLFNSSNGVSLNDPCDDDCVHNVQGQLFGLTVVVKASGPYIYLTEFGRLPIGASNNGLQEQCTGHRIRVYIMATNYLGTLTGTAQLGPGDTISSERGTHVDGKLTVARFLSPMTLTSDGEFLYVVEGGTRSIRKVRVVPKSQRATQLVLPQPHRSWWLNGTSTVAPAFPSCSSVEHCNNRADHVYGSVLTGCRCRCLKGYLGLQCERMFTVVNVSQPTVVLPLGLSLRSASGVVVTGPETIAVVVPSYHSVYEINTTTGVTHKIVGNNADRYAATPPDNSTNREFPLRSPTGLAYDVASSRLLVTEFDAFVVRSIVLKPAAAVVSPSTSRMSYIERFLGQPSVGLDAFNRPLFPSSSATAPVTLIHRPLGVAVHPCTKDVYVAMEYAIGWIPWNSSSRSAHGGGSDRAFYPFTGGCNDYQHAVVEGRYVPWEDFKINTNPLPLAVTSFTFRRGMGAQELPVPVDAHPKAWWTKINAGGGDATPPSCDVIPTPLLDVPISHIGGATFIFQSLSIFENTKMYATMDQQPLRSGSGQLLLNAACSDSLLEFNLETGTVTSLHFILGTYGYPAPAVDVSYTTAYYNQYSYTNVNGEEIVPNINDASCSSSSYGFRGIVSTRRGVLQDPVLFIVAVKTGNVVVGSLAGIYMVHLRTRSIIPIVVGTSKLDSLIGSSLQPEQGTGDWTGGLAYRAARYPSGQDALYVTTTTGVFQYNLDAAGNPTRSPTAESISTCRVIPSPLNVSINTAVVAAPTPIAGITPATVPALMTVVVPQEFSPAAIAVGSAEQRLYFISAPHQSILAASLRNITLVADAGSSGGATMGTEMRRRLSISSIAGLQMDTYRRQQQMDMLEDTVLSSLRTDRAVNGASTGARKLRSTGTWFEGTFLPNASFVLDEGVNGPLTDAEIALLPPRPAWIPRHSLWSMQDHELLHAFPSTADCAFVSHIAFGASSAANGASFTPAAPSDPSAIPRWSQIPVFGADCISLSNLPETMQPSGGFPFSARMTWDVVYRRTTQSVIVSAFDSSNQFATSHVAVYSGTSGRYQIISSLEGLPCTAMSVWESGELFVMRLAPDPTTSVLSDVVLSRIELDQGNLRFDEVGKLMRSGSQWSGGPDGSWYRASMDNSQKPIDPVDCDVNCPPRRLPLSIPRGHPYFAAGLALHQFDTVNPAVFFYDTNRTMIRMWLPRLNLVHSIAGTKHQRGSAYVAFSGADLLYTTAVRVDGPLDPNPGSATVATAVSTGIVKFNSPMMMAASDTTLFILDLLADGSNETVVVALNLSAAIGWTTASVAPLPLPSGVDAVSVTDRCHLDVHCGGTSAAFGVVGIPLTGCACLCRPGQVKNCTHLKYDPQATTVGIDLTGTYTPTPKPINLSTPFFITAKAAGPVMRNAHGAGMGLDSTTGRLIFIQKGGSEVNVVDPITGAEDRWVGETTTAAIDMDHWRAASVDPNNILTQNGPARVLGSAVLPGTNTSLTVLLTAQYDSQTASAVLAVIRREAGGSVEGLNSPSSMFLRRGSIPTAVPAAGGLVPSSLSEVAQTSQPRWWYSSVEIKAITVIGEMYCPNIQFSYDAVFMSQADIVLVSSPQRNVIYAIHIVANVATYSCWHFAGAWDYSDSHGRPYTMTALSWPSLLFTFDGSVAYAVVSNVTVLLLNTTDSSLQEIMDPLEPESARLQIEAWAGMTTTDGRQVLYGVLTNLTTSHQYVQRMDVTGVPQTVPYAVWTPVLGGSGANPDAAYLSTLKLLDPAMLYVGADGTRVIIDDYITAVAVGRGQMYLFSGSMLYSMPTNDTDTRAPGSVPPLSYGREGSTWQAPGTTPTVAIPSILMLPCNVMRDCSGRASAVSGWIYHCRCICDVGWHGPSCATNISLSGVGATTSLGVSFPSMDARFPNYPGYNWAQFYSAPPLPVPSPVTYVERILHKTNWQDVAMISSLSYNGLTQTLYVAVPSLNSILSINVTLGHGTQAVLGGGRPGAYDVCDVTHWEPQPGGVGGPSTFATSALGQTRSINTRLRFPMAVDASEDAGAHLWIAEADAFMVTRTATASGKAEIAIGQCVGPTRGVRIGRPFLDAVSKATRTSYNTSWLSTFVPPVDPDFGAGSGPMLPMLWQHRWDSEPRALQSTSTKQLIPKPLGVKYVKWRKEVFIALEEGPVLRVAVPPGTSTPASVTHFLGSGFYASQLSSIRPSGGPGGNDPKGEILALNEVPIRIRQMDMLGVNQFLAAGTFLVGTATIEGILLVVLDDALPPASWVSSVFLGAAGSSTNCSAIVLNTPWEECDLLTTALPGPIRGVATDMPLVMPFGSAGTQDTDGDGTVDAYDTDADGDGILDADILTVYFTAEQAVFKITPAVTASGVRSPRMMFLLAGTTGIDASYPVDGPNGITGVRFVMPAALAWSPEALYVVDIDRVRVVTHPLVQQRNHTMKSSTKPISKTPSLSASQLKMHVRTETENTQTNSLSVSTSHQYGVRIRTETPRQTGTRSVSNSRRILTTTRSQRANTSSYSASVTLTRSLTPRSASFSISPPVSLSQKISTSPSTTKTIQPVRRRSRTHTKTLRPRSRTKRVTLSRSLRLSGSHSHGRTVSMPLLETRSRSNEATKTKVSSVTMSPMNTRTETISVTPPPTETSSQSNTNAPVPTPTVTFTPTPSPSHTKVPVPTKTITFTVTPYLTKTRTSSKTEVPLPTRTNTFTVTPPPTPTPSMSQSTTRTHSFMPALLFASTALNPETNTTVWSRPGDVITYDLTLSNQGSPTHGGYVDIWLFNVSIVVSSVTAAGATVYDGSSNPTLPSAMPSDVYSQVQAAAGGGGGVPPSDSVLPAPTSTFSVAMVRIPLPANLSVGLPPVTFTLAAVILPNGYSVAAIAHQTYVHDGTAAPPLLLTDALPCIYSSNPFPGKWEITSSSEPLNTATFGSVITLQGINLFAMSSRLVFGSLVAKVRIVNATEVVLEFPPLPETGIPFPSAQPASLPDRRFMEVMGNLTRVGEMVRLYPELPPEQLFLVDLSSGSTTIAPDMVLPPLSVAVPEDLLSLPTFPVRFVMAYHNGNLSVSVMNTMRFVDPVDLSVVFIPDPTAATAMTCDPASLVSAGVAMKATVTQAVSPPAHVFRFTARCTFLSTPPTTADGYVPFTMRLSTALYLWKLSVRYYLPVLTAATPGIGYNFSMVVGVRPPDALVGTAATAATAVNRQFQQQQQQQAVAVHEVEHVHILAYSSEDTPVPMSVASDDVTCQNNNTNGSTSCDQVTLTSLSTWPIAAKARIPSFFQGLASVLIHVRARNAKWITVRHYLNGTARVVPTTPAPPPPARAATKDAGRALRNIFENKTCLGIFNFVVITLLLFLLMIAAKILWKIWVIRRGSIVNGVPGRFTLDLNFMNIGHKWSSLRMKHIYWSALFSCHIHCGPIHVLQLSVHVFIMYYLISLLINSKDFLPFKDPVSELTTTENFATILWTDVYVWARCIIIALISALGATALQPIFDVAFHMYRVVDRRSLFAGTTQSTALSRQEWQQDLTNHGVRSVEGLGLSEATKSQLAEIEMKKPDPVVVVTAQTREEEAADVQVCIEGGGNAILKAQAGGDKDPISGFFDDFDYDGIAIFNRYLAPPPPLPPPRKTSTIIVTADGSAASSDRASNGMRTSTGSTDVQTTAAPYAPRTSVIIDTGYHPVVGTVLLGFAWVALIIGCVINIADWCVPSMVVFFVCFGISVVIDAFVVQVAVMLLTLLFRWLIAEDDDDEEEGMLHPVHPFHNPVRYVGALPA